jgi:BTB/POZ domain
LSAEELLASFLMDDTLMDVTLKGNDGITVSANRFIPAAKSKVFHRMFFGNFREASSKGVGIGFPGHVLQSVVEYIHTLFGFARNGKGQTGKMPRMMLRSSYP